MAGGGRGRRKAAVASRTGGDAADKPSKRRRGGPLGHEVSAGSVHTKEIMAFDVAHTLRNGRRVLVPNTSKPGPPPQRFRKGGREKSVYDESWKIHACAKVALEHYNRLNEDDVHELVRAVDGRLTLYNGEWIHVNFIAKSKQGTPKPFFAELKTEGVKEISCTICTDMDPDDPKTAPVRDECGCCPRRIFHPAAGGYIGANPAPGDIRAEDLGAAPGGGSEEFASLCNAELL